MEDVIKLSNVQMSLLEAATRLVKPGGILMYVTCSLQPEEGEHLIELFLESAKNFKRVPVKPEEIPELPAAINEKGELRTLPSFLEGKVGGIDGFFAVRLSRAA